MTEVTLTILSEIVDRLFNHWRDDSAVMGLYATRQTNVNFYSKRITMYKQFLFIYLDNFFKFIFLFAYTVKPCYLKF